VTKKTTILIADDHPLFRKGLKEVIVANERLSVVHESSDGADALKFIEEQKPEIAILDVDMPGLKGLDVAKAAEKKRLPVKIVILTMYNEADIFHRAMDLGVMGYVLKESAVDEILGCIKSVGAGKHFVSPALSGHLLGRSQRLSRKAEETLGLNDLTKTERKVLGLIASNKSTKAIAEELFVSPRTVEHHRSHICSKLKLSGPNALLRFALEHKDML
jgi:DNA-binding NarL/FixJ family response regulator